VNLTAPGWDTMARFGEKFKDNLGYASGYYKVPRKIMFCEINEFP